MYQTVDFHIEGIVPCMMHNGQTADPLNEWAKEKKKLTSKRNKTEEDIEAINKISFLSAFYLDSDGHPCWPGENIESMMIAGAKKNKLGTTFKAAVLCDGIWPLIYDGPKDVQKLWEDRNFVDTRTVVVQRARTTATRPIFKEWSLKFTVHFLPDQIDKQSIIDVMNVCGSIIGLSDYRPKFGRFRVISAK